jgi:hypothetical protein
MKLFGTSLFQTATRFGFRLLLSLVMLCAVALPFATAAEANYYPPPYYPYYNPYIPVFSIVSVASDSSVTIQTANFPANQKFTVRMGYYGTLGINGVVVGTTDSGAGGSFQATYTIPDSLKGQNLIAIRMDNDSGYYYSYNWFVNKVAVYPAPSGGVPPAPQPVYFGGVPTFSITSVAKDSSVVIRTNNFPANEKFTVQMGYYGTYALNGVVVATTDSGAGGSFDATYTVPDSLKGQGKIAIRMDSPTGYYFSYNWFYNNTAP